MHQEHLLQRRRHRGHPVQQLLLVRMPAQRVDRLHLRAHPHRLAQDVHLLLLRHQLAAQRVRRLIARDQHQVPRVLDPVLQVMQNPPGLAHARRRHHHKWHLQLVQRLALLHRLRILQPVPPERVFSLGEECARIRVPIFLVLLENLGHGGRQRAVHKDRELRNLLRFDHLVQQQHQLLRPLHCKRRSDNMPAARQHSLHQPRQLGLHIAHRSVQPVAVRALHNQVVRRRCRIRVLDDRQVLPPHIAREQHPHRLPLLRRLQQHVGRPQHVPRIRRRHREPGILRRARQHLRLMQLHRLEQRARRRRVVLRIQRRQRSRPRRHLDLLPPSIPLANKLRIALLDMCRIFQHRPAQVNRRRRRIDRPAIPLLRQQRQVAAMVDVRMRQHHRIQPRRRFARKLLRRQRQVRVDVRRIVPPALKQPAVQQNILPRTLQMMRRPGDGLVRPPEMQTNCHALSL